MYIKRGFRAFYTFHIRSIGHPSSFENDSDLVRVKTRPHEYGLTKAKELTFFETYNFGKQSLSSS